MIPPIEQFCLPLSFINHSWSDASKTVDFWHSKLNKRILRKNYRFDWREQPSLCWRTDAAIKRQKKIWKGERLLAWKEHLALDWLRFCHHFDWFQWKIFHYQSILHLTHVASHTLAQFCVRSSCIEFAFRWLIKDLLFFPHLLTFSGRFSFGHFATTTHRFFPRNVIWRLPFKDLIIVRLKSNMIFFNLIPAMWLRNWCKATCTRSSSLLNLSHRTMWRCFFIKFFAV